MANFSRIGTTYRYTLILMTALRPFQYIEVSLLKYLCSTTIKHPGMYRNIMKAHTQCSIPTPNCSALYVSCEESLVLSMPLINVEQLVCLVHDAGSQW